MRLQLIYKDTEEIVIFKILIPIIRICVSALTIFQGQWAITDYIKNDRLFDTTKMLGCTKNHFILLHNVSCLSFLRLIVSIAIISRLFLLHYCLSDNGCS